MNKKQQLFFGIYAIRLAIFLIAWVLLGIFFNATSILIKAAIAGGMMILLSPRIKRIQTQTGRKVQVKWIFTKTPLTFYL